MNVNTGKRMKADERGRLAVANYVSQQIDLSHKMQKELAEEMGYDNPNIITMVKQARTPIPLNRTAQWAKALGIDPLHFFRIVMKNYHPQTWEAIERVIGNYTVTKNELEIIKIIREVAKEDDMAPESEEEKQELISLAEKWKKRRSDDVALARTGELHHKK